MATPLARAVIAYTDALESCANSPDKMASHCTVQGDTLDDLYVAMLKAARTQHHPTTIVMEVAPITESEDADDVANEILSLARPLIVAFEKQEWENVVERADWLADAALQLRGYAKERIT